jgi:hypothetical protein
MIIWQILCWILQVVAKLKVFYILLYFLGVGGVNVPPEYLLKFQFLSSLSIQEL